MMTLIKEIPGYEWNYFIDTEWNIYHRSTSYKDMRISNAWYRMLALYQNGRYYRHSIHRLLAMTFLPIDEERPWVNHIDGDKLNNNLDNLEWVTPSENSLHSYSVLWNKWSHTWRFWKRNHKSISVDQYNMSGEFIKSRDCIEEIWRILWYDPSCIVKVCKWKRKHSHNFVRRYRDPMIFGNNSGQL